MSLPYLNLIVLWVLPTILVVLIVITRRDLTTPQYVGLLGLTCLIPVLGAIATVLYYAGWALITWPPTTAFPAEKSWACLSPRAS